VLELLIREGVLSGSAEESQNVFVSTNQLPRRRIAQGDVLPPSLRVAASVLIYPINQQSLCMIFNSEALPASSALHAQLATESDWSRFIVCCVYYSTAALYLSCTRSDGGLQQQPQLRLIYHWYMTYITGNIKVVRNHHAHNTTLLTALA